MAEPTVVCPKCGHKFPLTKALTEHLEESLRKEFEIRMKESDQEAKATFEKRLAGERDRIEKQATTRAAKSSASEVRKLQALLASAGKREKATQADFNHQLATEKTRLQREAVQQARLSVSTEIASLRKQMRERDQELREMQENYEEIQKREKAVKAKEQSLQRTIAHEVEAARKKTLLETSERIEQEYHGRELRHQKMITDLKQELTEAKRRLEQASQQAQGEVIELELEHNLSAAFSDDKIEAIAHGKLGADIVQWVMSPTGQQCGKIVWESKNTRNWSKAWITKLKSDQRKEKAEIAVLVSSALPTNFKSHFGQMSGVWVSDFSVAIGLATALRFNLIDVARVKMVDRNKPQNMEILYRYLMSTEFRQRVEAIVEGFVAMRSDLLNEKQAAERNWARREKHLELVLQNVSGMVGDIQAITPAFPNIKRLELSEPG
jgi:hypothetical protein